MAQATDASTEIIQDINDTYYTNYVAFAGFTVLVWDQCITFGDEVDLIWNGSKGPLVYLFLLNRYLTPLGFIVNVVAYMLPTWGKEQDRCNHYIKYEGTMTAIGIQIVGMMMFLRVRAMYKGKKVIIWTMACLFIVWTGVNAYLIAYSEALPHAQGVHSCTSIFDQSVHKIAPASAWLPLLYDTAVFLLTLNKTMPSIRHKQAGHIVYTLFKDGILYYSVICAVNVVVVIMMPRAPAGVRNIAIQLELLLTVAMMSRITLNLKKQAMYGPAEVGTAADTIYPYSHDWTPSEPSSARRSGSASCSRANGSLRSQRHSTDIRFARGPMSYSQRFTLSTIFSRTPTPVAMSPMAGSPVRNLSWEITGSATRPTHGDIEAP